MNRDTQSVLLVLLGGAVVRISVDDTYLRYVRSWTRPYLLTAGAVLVGLGLLSLWREHIGRTRAELRPELEAQLPHDHGSHPGPGVAWLLLLPVFAIFLVAPPALGSFSAARGVNAVAKPAQSEFARLPDGDPVTVSLTDFATRAIWDDGRSLQGRRVRLVGFVSPRADGHYYLARLVIACCAADARPVKITVQGGEPGFAADQWVAVTGTYGGIDPSGGAEQIPVIRAESVQPVAAPAEPYES